MDRWGDYDWIFGAAKANLKIVELPVHYVERVAGETKMRKRLRNSLDHAPHVLARAAPAEAGVTRDAIAGAARRLDRRSSGSVGAQAEPARRVRPLVHGAPEACPGRPIVELGCGPGFFKERHPDVIATDAIVNPHADAIVEAAALPFGEARVGSIVLLDVFHHLPRPAAFLEEAARVLRPGGRLAMLEPWVGTRGTAVLPLGPSRGLRPARRPAATRGARTRKGAMEGNAALPYLYFRAGGHLEHLGAAVARRAA